MLTAKLLQVFYKLSFSGVAIATVLMHVAKTLSYNHAVVAAI